MTVVTKAIRFFSPTGETIPVEVIQLESGNYALVFSNAEEAVVDLTVAGNLTVGGISTLNGDVTLVTANLLVGGTGHVTGTFQADGATLIDDTLHVTGNTTLDGTLGVTGLATVANLHATGDFELEGAFNQDGSTFGALNATPVAQQVLAPLTNSTGDAPGATIGAISTVGAADTGTDLVDISTVAKLANVNTSFGQVQQDLSSLAGKVNEIEAILKAFGFTKEA